jgi:putative transposase
MKQGQVSQEQIIGILQQAERGEQTVAALCRASGIMDRLWRTAKLQVPKRRRRRPHAGVSVAATTQATLPGHVRTYDFVHGACLTGTKLTLLPVVDEFTRECLAIEVATAMPAERVITVLDRLFLAYGAPEYLRSDNGPEFVAHVIQGWLALPSA